MKTGKKIIAMVLVIVLALSVMPMAFSAEECEHVFNTETLERPKDPMGKGCYICSACNKTVYVEMANFKDFYMALYEWYTIVEDVYIYQKTFDPEMHEAVMSIEDESKGEKEIVEVFRTGYKMKDKVVRHSLVKVAN